jgi:hypothetical protein
VIARTPVARVAASILLAGALVAGTSGCTFFATQATLIKYDPSDGISANVGDLHVRNALALASDDGKTLSLTMSIVNSGKTGQALSIQYQIAGVKTTESRFVDANSVVTVGTTATDSRILIANPDVKAGGLLPVYVQYGNFEGQQLLVPVLNADIAQYNTLKPTDAPTTK